jgi:hypothetical protein
MVWGRLNATAIVAAINLLRMDEKGQATAQVYWLKGSSGIGE